MSHLTLVIMLALAPLSWGDAHKEDVAAFFAAFLIAWIL